jgi:hypothetical protein
MACECRRIVTGHTLEGKSTVLYDSSVPLLEADSAAGARQEDRAGAALAHPVGPKPTPNPHRFRPCTLAVHRTARRRRAPNPGSLPKHIQPHPGKPERRKR